LRDSARSRQAHGVAIWPNAPGPSSTFEDGKSALYSSDLLHGTFPQAEELKETELVQQS